MPKMKPLRFTCNECDCRFKARVSEKHTNVVNCPQCDASLKYTRDSGLPLVKVFPLGR